jgi:hypothetical protein
LRFSLPPSSSAVRVAVVGRRGLIARSRSIVVVRAGRTPADAAPGTTLVSPTPGTPTAAPTTPAADLSPGEELAPGQELRSPNGDYRLIMQVSDGNLVLYRGSTALWSTTPSGSGARAVMQGDGNFVVYRNGEAKWSSTTGGFPGAKLRLQDDGNAVVYLGIRPLWARAAGYLANTLRPGEALEPAAILRSASGQYTLAMQGTDGNLVLYKGGTALWSTTAKGSGARAVMQGDGNFVVYNGGVAKWWSGTDRFPGASLVLQDDGNVVLYADGHPIWAYAVGFIGDRLSGGQFLRPGAHLYSPSKQYMLIMQATDGNLVLYGPGGAAYAFNTAGYPGASAVMQGDGNFVVYAGSTALAHTQTGGNAGAYVRVQDDGNIVVYQGGTALWSRFTGLLGSGGSGPNGPQNFPNSAIADRSDAYAAGAYGGQCLVFATSMIKAAGGPQFYFGFNTGTYQGQWAQRATEISGIANARRGDIIQWGGGAGGNLLHTAIVTVAGSNPSVVDSNWAGPEVVGRGSFNSRNVAGSVYRIWRVGKV